MNVYLRELARELGRRGIEVDIFTRCHDGARAEVNPFAANARVIHLPAAERGTAKSDIFPHLPRFLDELVRFSAREGLDYDLVHSHYWLSGWVSNRLRWWWGVGHVATFHTLAAMKNRSRLGVRETRQRLQVERQVVAACDRVVATTAFEKSQLVRFYGAETAKIEVIPCGVNLDLFRPVDKARARRSLGISAAKMVLSVGRIDPVKGIDLLLRAVACLEDKEGLEVLIVGGDDHSHALEELKRLAWKLDIGERVTFSGAVAHHRLPLYYSAADVLLMPSYYESFGMVALEALACATPVIASRVGALASTIRDGETGYLISGHCPEPYAERLELLLGNETLNRSFSAAATSSVERYAWPAIADSILEVYEALTNGQLAGSGAL